MPNLGPFEIVVIAVVVILLFGTRRLPELGSGLGKAISNFRSAFKDGSASESSTIEVTKDKSKNDSNV